jgi:hypothetical protein
MRFRYLVISLALLGTFASDSRGQSKQPPAQSKQATQPPATDQRGTDQVPLAVKILPAQDAKEQSDKAEHERKEKAVIDGKLAFETQRIADYTDRLALFTVLLFCVAVAQAGLFLWQLRYMRQGMRDSEMAAKAAQDSAEATRDSVTLARDTAQRQLRAYVFLDRIDIPIFNNPVTHQTERRIYLAWKNTGGTRTRRFMARVSHTIVDRSDLDTFRFADADNATNFSGLIGPQQSVNLPPIPIEAQWLPAALSDDQAFLIWGWAEYRDIFCETVRRTEFAFRVRAEGTDSNNCIIRFASTEKHNAADEDCMHPPQSRL